MSVAIINLRATYVVVTIVRRELLRAGVETLRSELAHCIRRVPERGFPRPAGAHIGLGRHTPLRSRTRTCEPC